VRILVTGGAGYIGSVTTAELIAAGHDVVVVDDLSTGHADAVPVGAEFHEAAITDLDDVIGAWAIDAVIHFAAKALVGESVIDPAAYWRNNVVGTLALLDTLRRHGITRIVFSSTSATYGDAQEVPITESAPTLPTSPYGASKLAVDSALTDYAPAYGLTAISLRYFNVAGARIDPNGAHQGERHAVETHLIPIALQTAAGEREALEVYGTDYPTPDGTCIRDYIHVVDLADAHIRALSVGEPGRHQVVNLGSGIGYSVREVIDSVEMTTGRRPAVREVGRRPGDPAITLASNERAATFLGWRPERGLAEMVGDAWRFHRRHLA
jgi:UDP-glucose 4-epimerase